MVNIIKEKTFGSEFGRAIGTGLGEGGSEGFAKAVQLKQDKKKLDQENEEIFKHTGIRLTSTNPEMRKLEFAERLKTQGKKDLWDTKIKSLGELGMDYGENQKDPELDVGQQNNYENPDMQIAITDQSKPSINKPQQKKLPPKYPQAKIDQMSLIDPNLAKSWIAHNKAVDAEQRHQEEQSLKSDIAHKKEVSGSFSENKDYINKTYDQYEDSLRREAILERMGQLEESGDLSDSGVYNLLETLGLNPEWIKNPKNEEYTKLTLDLLGGGALQADYGSRVLASEFKVSQQRVPSLSQTPEGRRQIRENIQTMLLPAKLKKERMQYYLDKSELTGEPLPHNIRGKILNDIKPQLEEAYDKFKQRNGRYKVKEGTIPDDNSMEKYFYLADENPEKALKLMREDGYSVD
jgi:hypothetical protein